MQVTNTHNFTAGSFAFGERLREAISPSVASTPLAGSGVYTECVR